MYRHPHLPKKNRGELAKGAGRGEYRGWHKRQKRRRESKEKREKKGSREKKLLYLKKGVSLDLSSGSRERKKDRGIKSQRYKSRSFCRSVLEV
ncbi:MAG: hypothetical protein A3E80_02825 [Chlamydiae bacterium RIFCSPHIGHO2_12_FULL_49_9]|nr:MAG: hypothetical protein A3E80_02825 [Chlamydiae bacterium RIFCSPHIGHO2_12_FULL_49_9]